jgi:hypothetical protein
VEHGAFEVGAIQGAGLDRRHPEHVLGLLLGHDVDHVVDGDEADHAAVLLKNGHGQEVILRDLLRDGLPVLERRHGDGMAPHDGGDRLLELRHHQIPE